MSTKAYFLINVSSQDGYVDAMTDLKAMPEIKSVVQVFGQYDILAEVEAPVRVISVANKVMDKDWVRRLHVLKVEEDREAGEALRLKRQRELIKGVRASIS